jgi:predicted TIM-barrel fold metal-dependent hydrolase
MLHQPSVAPPGVIDENERPEAKSMRIDRREFLGTLAVAAMAAESSAQPTADPWGAPVLDCHLHLRGDGGANIAHMDGCGVTKAVILASNAVDRASALQAKYPRRVVWSGATDVAQAGADARLRQAHAAGARGFGELKSHVEADGPELQRVYAMAAELGLPVMVHFQEVEHFPGEGLWGTGFTRFEAMLRKYPKTRFFVHADAVWANIDGAYANETSYPTGPIRQKGLTDRLLADYPNIYGDLSANSGNNALSRDTAFTAAFLTRHQDKLVFGSDCGCRDGRGAGNTMANNPPAIRMKDKCVARETLTLLKASTTPLIFRKIVWENGHGLYGIAM